jgi:hypothetical protein
MWTDVDAAFGAVPRRVQLRGFPDDGVASRAAWVRLSTARGLETE